MLVLLIVLWVMCLFGLRVGFLMFVWLFVLAVCGIVALSVLLFDFVDWFKGCRFISLVAFAMLVFMCYYWRLPVELMVWSRFDLRLLGVLFA